MIVVMFYEKQEDRNAVLALITGIINGHLRVAASEQDHPTGGADDSEREISDSLKKAMRLRRLRDEFEEITSGVILTFSDRLEACNPIVSKVLKEAAIDE